MGGDVLSQFGERSSGRRAVRGLRVHCVRWPTDQFKEQATVEGDALDGHVHRR